MPLRRLKELPLLLVAGLLVLPVLAILGSWFSWNAASGQILREMAATVLPDYALTSLLLCACVGIGVAV
ncbi:MAG TPA: iron ABC transporter permease, partial [Ramlibacter sp.]|nr:iron ABC transporter permease [Ramlibacter sp.]